ncbi:HOG (high osmolarity glycerol) pathway protein, partial [Ascosphaera pollenicola]
RDFAYAETHPLYHGPPANPDPSNPENDDELADGSGRQDTEGSRPAPDWNPDAMYDNTLPPTSFGDGPPYSEDEDLHSPILITTRRRKSKGIDGRSPDVAGEFDNEKGIFVSDNGDGTETYYMPDEDALEDGPGGEYVTYDDWQEDDSRLSRDFHFAITSPDEEMHGKAIALFDFQSMHENELPLREGQVILVSYRHGEGWLVAEDPKTGESGLVPEAYVRLARHIEGGLNSLNGEQGFENDTSQHADVNGEEEEGGEGEGEDDGDSQVLETPASQKTDELKELQGDANNDVPKEEQDGSKVKSDDGSKGQGKRKPSPIDCTKDVDKSTELGVNGSAK